MTENTEKLKPEENIAQTDSGTESKGGIFNVQQKLENLEARFNNLSERFINVKEDFEKLEKNIEKTNNFMMWAVGIAVGVFMISGILISLDYFKNNEDRYENFVSKTEEIKNNFYSKDDLKGLIDENNKDKQILDCLKDKGYFTIQCFNQ